MYMLLVKAFAVTNVVNIFLPILRKGEKVEYQSTLSHTKGLRAFGRASCVHSSWFSLGPRTFKAAKQYSDTVFPTYQFLPPVYLLMVCGDLSQVSLPSWPETMSRA